jgi:hypothetical protein
MSRLTAVAIALLALVLPAPGQDSLNCRQVGLWPESPELLTEAWSIDLDPERGLAFLGTFLYDTIWEDWTFCILDVTDRSQPRLLSANSTQCHGDSYDVHHNSNRLYLGTEGDGFAVWDVSDPNAPDSLGALNVQYAGFRLTVVGDYAYLAALDDGLRVVDVSDPRNPVEVGHSTAGYAWDVAVAGELAYVVTNGLWLVNISDPTNPYTVGSCPIDGDHLGVAVAGGYAYLSSEFLTTESAYVNVIDVSNPENPVLVASEFVGRECYRLAVSDGFLYVAAGTTGLVIFDVRNPENPVRVGHYRVGGVHPLHANDVAVSGGLTYVVGGFWGLRIIEFLGAGVEEPESAPVARPAFRLRPNPARNSVHLAGSETAELYAPDGRKVAALAPGRNDVRQLARGVYFVRRQDSGESSRLVLVR